MLKEQGQGIPGASHSGSCANVSVPGTLINSFFTLRGPAFLSVYQEWQCLSGTNPALGTAADAVTSAVNKSDQSLPSVLQFRGRRLTQVCQL